MTGYLLTFSNILPLIAGYLLTSSNLLHTAMTAGVIAVVGFLLVHVVIVIRPIAVRGVASVHGVGVVESVRLMHSSYSTRLALAFLEADDIYEMLGVVAALHTVLGAKLVDIGLLVTVVVNEVRNAASQFCARLAGCRLLLLADAASLSERLDLFLAG